MRNPNLLEYVEVEPIEWNLERGAKSSKATNGGDGYDTIFVNRFEATVHPPAYQQYG